jgi:hypothetical protein
MSEIMRNPEVVPDGMGGEWIELHNPTGASYQLGGCTLEVVAPAASVAIDMDLVAGPGDYLALAETSMAGPGFLADYEWTAGGLPLPDGDGEIRLVCDAVVVDTVAYDDGVAFPADTPGTALNLDPTMLDATANDLGANWCDALASYDGDLGTPGLANTSCDPTFAIDFCRLQSPLVISELPSTDVTVYGRLYIAGLTDQSNGNDLASSVGGWVGYGPDGSDPAVDPGWVWMAATPNLGWNGAAAGEPNNDEYQATLTVPATGTYDYAYRFSGNFGYAFTYCDGDAGGNSTGYAPADAGQMTAL